MKLDNGLLGGAMIEQDVNYIPQLKMDRSLTKKLEYEKTSLEERLAKVNEALTALKANPEIERVLNLISRV